MTLSAIMSAFWLGILTAISPCPLATNIAAMSFIGRKAGEKKQAFKSVLFYSFGRMLAYVLLGVTISIGLLASAEVSRFLQKHMNELLGPILIFAGLLLLGQINFYISLNLGLDRLQKKVDDGIIWSGVLGIIFALSFCPVSAGLFFGGLLPLSLRYESKIILPIVYGIGTSLPVVLFAFLTAFGASHIGKVFIKLHELEKVPREVTGVIFVLIGIYYCLIHVYGITF